MAKRTSGGLLIVAAVLLAPLVAAIVAFNGREILAGNRLVGLAAAADLSMVGAGVLLIGLDGRVFGGVLARRGLKTLGAALLGDAMLALLMTQAGIKGIAVMMFFIPLIVLGWATAIGTGAVILALLLAGGRPRLVGATFLVIPIGLALVNLEANGPRPSPGRAAWPTQWRLFRFEAVVTSIISSSIRRLRG